PAMEARSLMRSARAASLTSKPAMIAITTIRPFWIPLMPPMFNSLSERQHAQEEASQPAHDLGGIDKPVTLELEPRVGDLGRIHGVLRVDQERIHDPGEAHELLSLLEADLLLARHQQVAV